MRFVWLSAVLAVVASVSVAKDFKVGYVDYDRVIEKYEAAIEAKKEMDTVRVKFEAKAESLKTDYEQSQQEYESQKLTLSEDGKRAKAAEVDGRKKRYDSYVTEVYAKSGKIDQRYKELIAPIVQKIDSEVGRVAVEDGYALVLDASKSGVVYSQDGLDLTQYVLDNLNREFAPVGPTTREKAFYAIMPIFDQNDQAQTDKIGFQIRTFANQLIGGQPKTDMVANSEVDRQLTARGTQGQQIQLDKALEAARALDADYTVFGTCTKQDRRIQFELSIADVRLGTLVKTQKGDAARVEELNQQVGEVVRVLLASVEKP